jgi:redox-sensitive bicupin YhaK (pirin superfamily)
MTTQVDSGCSKARPTFGANRQRARRGQIALLGAGQSLSVTDAAAGTRFLLMAGKLYGETPIYNGPYVD